MNLHLSIGPLVSLVAGVLILAMPRLLNYIVAVYLILIGLIGIFGTGGLQFHCTAPAMLRGAGCSMTLCQP